MTHEDKKGKFLLPDDENRPSGTSTPVFTWSPLPPRKHFNIPKNKKTENSSKCESSVKLYPNCDVKVWLRSCEKEIIEPIEGELTGKVLHPKINQNHIISTK
ncbi:unnamed protein product [Phaedon cochleariae]|uniref:Uncharacterized protein n=1 Tax=Phaedon cochleariae TaxID=80249 RepID=A0A9N9SI69_PHACE|nr:unnamed protein product [Phaedon cochleariae]